VPETHKIRTSALPYPPPLVGSLRAIRTSGNSRSARVPRTAEIARWLASMARASLRLAMHLSVNRSSRETYVAPNTQSNSSRCSAPARAIDRIASPRCWRSGNARLKQDCDHSTPVPEMLSTLRLPPNRNSQMASQEKCRRNRCGKRVCSRRRPARRETGHFRNYLGHCGTKSAKALQRKPFELPNELELESQKGNPGSR
jgi:hypothetical protein